ncbi:MAG: MATE family efflux transporter [Velocimicrobium sp.]
MNEIQDSKTLENPLAKDFNCLSLLAFAFPTMIMMISMGFYTIGDTIIVSRFVNTNALSALNIVCPVINIIVGIGTMLATGGSAIVARKMGEGETKRAQQDFTLIVLTCVGIGILIAVSGILFIDKIIYRLGSNEVLYPYCKDYLFILLLFTPASMLQVLFQNLIVTAGRPSFGMFLSVSGGLINIILDYIFIVTFGMGIAGSALGTGIAYMIPTVTGIIFFSLNKGSLRFRIPVSDYKIIIESCLNGSSEMVGQIATAITTFLFNVTMMKFFGEHGVAAITIIIYTQFMMTTLYIGFSMGVAPIISYNYGNDNYIRLQRILRICLLFISLASIAIFLFAMFMGTPLVSIFSPRGTEVYQIAQKGFLIFPFTFLFCGINIFISATFTALSNGKISAIISFLRTFVFITLGLLLLPIYFNVIGVWLAVPLAEFATLFLSVGFIWKYSKKYHLL